jgi:hypothetical protein
MEDILQYELLQQAEAEKAAAAAISDLLREVEDNQLREELNDQRKAVVDVEWYKAKELGAVLPGLTGEGEKQQRQDVIYTPYKGKRPYKDSPVAYVNLSSLKNYVARERKRSLAVYEKAYFNE